MHRKFLYVINPISGTRSKRSLKEVIGAKTRSAGFEAIFFPSVADGDYAQLHSVIREQQVTDVIIAGGDGTINGVVDSVKGLDVQFGIIPCGSGNGLAFSAGIPKAWGRALDVIFRGHSRWTDAFTVNGDFACMLCGIGFDAQVAHDFANDPNRGLVTYVKQSIRNFFSAKTYPFAIQNGTGRFKTEAFFISIANSNQFGNNFTIAPKASLSDGLLDIVIVTRQNKLSLLVQTALQVGGFNKLQEVPLVSRNASVIYFQTEELTISNRLGAPMHIDGDPAASQPVLNIKVLPGCFKLIVP